MKITQKNSKTERWKLCIAAWKVSNKNVRQWCIEHSIPKSTFIYWKDKFSKESLNKEGFVEILEEQPTRIEVRCNGFEIHVGKEFDEHTLSRCLKLIRSCSC